MSGVNYVDGDVVREDMYKLARERKGEKVTVSWIPNRPDEIEGISPRIRESLKHYRKDLSAHMQRHKIETGAILEMRTEVYVAQNNRIYVRSYALDDRGKEHVQFVWA